MDTNAAIIYQKKGLDMANQMQVVWNISTFQRNSERQNLVYIVITRLLKGGVHIAGVHIALSQSASKRKRDDTSVLEVSRRQDTDHHNLHTFFPAKSPAVLCLSTLHLLYRQRLLHLKETKETNSVIMLTTCIILPLYCIFHLYNTFIIFNIFIMIALCNLHLFRASFSYWPCN
jgi:hypothetical protein